MRMHFLSCVLILCVALTAPAQEVSPPLVEMKFEDGFANTGALGGEGRVEVYAKDEEPYLVPGPMGDCLDMTAASRFGGTIEQLTPAGSAITYSNTALDALDNFTVMLWMRATPEMPDVASRLLTKLGSWEIMYGNGRPVFLAVQGDKKPHYSFPPPRSGGWSFLAVSVDMVNSRICLYSGDRDGGLSPPNAQALTHVPASSEGTLYIGNFVTDAGGIRPFKGWMDNVRIYKATLTPEQIKVIFEDDCLGWCKGRSVYTTGLALVAPRKFQPRPSDIFFSCRWQNRLTKDGFELLEAFHVTHLLWVYGSNPEPIKQVHERGIFYEGTLNGECGAAKATHDRSAAGDTTGRQQDFDGNKVVLPHMAKWKWLPWTGCQNNPNFRKLFWEEAAQLVSAGVDGIMVDDWAMAEGTARSGMACFCPACIAGFREYLKRRLTLEDLRKMGIADIEGFDYRAFLKTKYHIQNQEQYKAKFRAIPLTPHFLDFQREGLRKFYSDFRQHLDTLSPNKHITMAMNCQFRWRTTDDSFFGYYICDLFDFLDGEASKNMQSASDYIQPCKTAEAFGIPQVMQTKPAMVQDKYAIGPPRAALATCYALGQWFLVPWDLYMDNDADGQPAPRYFGTVNEWGDLYDFIHANKHLFDGYQSTASVGVLFNADAAPAIAVKRICDRLAERQIQFRLIGAVARYYRKPLSIKELSSVRAIIAVSPEETFCEADRKTLADVRAARTVRFFKPEDEIDSFFQNSCLPSIRVEGPKNIYAFLRIKPGPAPSAVIHVVNWNILADGSGADPFSNITLSLSPAEAWGTFDQVKYYRPGQKVVQDIQSEQHRDFLRITLPRLETWGVVEIKGVR